LLLEAIPFAKSLEIDGLHDVPQENKHAYIMGFRKIAERHGLFDLTPSITGAIQPFAPLIRMNPADCVPEDRELVFLNVGEYNTHSHVWENKYHSSEGSKRGACIMDCDANPCAFRRGIHHVEEASTHTQVTASTAKSFVGSDFGYFHRRPRRKNGFTIRTSSLATLAVRTHH
jgi:hypothetical protein